jgi:hypothetical protein
VYRLNVILQGRFASQESFIMPKTLTFLHTSPVHIATFNGLLAEIDPTIPVRHLVDESLLRDARANGITPGLEQRITKIMFDAMADDAVVVVCTCSTIGGCAEQVGDRLGRPVIRVDRAMAERAVASGERIIVLAALASTLAPTRELIQEVADQQGRAVSISEALCEDAWVHFERGDQARYLSAIASCVHDAASCGDVIVLAQASMAGAAALCSDLSIPILSSPRLGLEAALEVYRSLV